METTSNPQRLHITVFGDVQAVGYRFTAIEVARDLGLVGWVKNNPDGSVEAIVEGSREKLENYITWAKTGPPLSEVNDLKVDWQRATGEFSGFEVRY